MWFTPSAKCSSCSFVGQTRCIGMSWGRFPYCDLLSPRGGSFFTFSLYLIAVEMMSLEAFISLCSQDVVLCSTLCLAHFDCLWPNLLPSFFGLRKSSRCFVTVTNFHSTPWHVRPIVFCHKKPIVDAKIYRQPFIYGLELSGYDRFKKIGVVIDH